MFIFVRYYKSLLRYVRGRTDEQHVSEKRPSVSVVIVAENSSEYLAENLPAILNQDYPDFDVVVVNNGSTDETDVVIKALQQKYVNLYGTYLPASTDTVSRQMMALTIAFKAAKNELILLTEPYCRPLSPNWISLMVSRMTDQVGVVAGHSVFRTKPDGKSHRSIAFDNVMYALRYLSAVILNKPYSATYRNLLVRKSLFFSRKGFATELGLDHGEELFLHRLLKDEETRTSLIPESFTEAFCGEAERPIWRTYRRGFLQIRKRFSGMRHRLFGLHTLGRYLMLVSWLALLLKSIYEMHFSTLIVATLLGVYIAVFEMVTFKKLAILLQGGRFLLSWFWWLWTSPFRNRYGKVRKARI